MTDNIFDELIGSEEEKEIQQRKLWTCPQCKMQFKWDTQLLRHERKTKHQNPDREARRERRGKKQNPKTQFACDYCWNQYSTNIQLLNHRPWCLNDPHNGRRARSYLSSWNQSQFECLIHEIPQYFSNVQQLQMHISTHKQRHEIKENQNQRVFTSRRKPIKIIRRQRIDSQMIERLSKEFRKFRKLSKEQAERIARAKGISITTVRRYFKYYKENEQ